MIELFLEAKVLAHEVRCSSPFTIFHWISLIAQSLTCVGARGVGRNWTQCSRYGLVSTEGKDHFPLLAGTTLPNTAQDTLSLLSNKSTLLTHVQHDVHQDTLVSMLRYV